MNQRKTRLFHWLLGVLLMGALLAVAVSNKDMCARNGVSAVSFSRESGFYTDAFDLELRADGGTVYYTLDCSDPDENSLVYTGPIHIDDASTHENVYSMNTDVNLEFREDMLVGGGSTMRYHYDLPKGLVDKATVVRAVCINGKGERGDVTNAAYFVGYDDKEGYTGMRVVSIATDPANLFDYEEGIYVLGKAFDALLTDGKIQKMSDNNYGTWPANYRQKGRGWEREAYVCCFDEDRSLMFSGKYGLRVQGGSSRGLLPKSLNLFARKEYGASSFSYEALFGRPGQLDSINLHSGAQSVYNKLTDYIVNMNSDGLRYATRDYVPTVVFLEGEFWGFYWMTPRYEEEYFKYNYNVSEDNLLVLKASTMEIGTIEDKETYYTPVLTYICDNDMRDPEKYEKACEMIDIQSCIDFFATESYIANVDWPHHNVQIWRTKEVGSGEYCDTRWRWIMYDTNVAMELPYATRDVVARAIQRSDMFASLMENKDFSRAIYAKLVDLAQNNFNPSRIDGFIDDYRLFASDVMEKECARFYGDNRTVADFADSCNRIKLFFRQRYDYIMSEYGEYGDAQ